MATKEEKQLFQDLEKEVHGLNTRIERLTRQIEIQNLISVLQSGSNYCLSDNKLIELFDDLLRANDLYESRLKEHAIDVAKKKSQLLKNEEKDGD